MKQTWPTANSVRFRRRSPRRCGKGLRSAVARELLADTAAFLRELHRQTELSIQVLVDALAHMSDVELAACRAAFDAGKANAITFAAELRRTLDAFAQFVEPLGDASFKQSVRGDVLFEWSEHTLVVAVRGDRMAKVHRLCGFFPGSLRPDGDRFVMKGWVPDELVPVVLAQMAALDRRIETIDARDLH